jgi:hypothetical protein
VHETPFITYTALDKAGSSIPAEDIQQSNNPSTKGNFQKKSVRRQLKMGNCEEKCAQEPYY